ncbi:Unknown protein, partial [Striga hermonthica]
NLGGIFKIWLKILLNIVNTLGEKPNVFFLLIFSCYFKYISLHLYIVIDREMDLLEIVLKSPLKFFKVTILSIFRKWRLNENLNSNLEKNENKIT